MSEISNTPDTITDTSLDAALALSCEDKALHMHEVFQGELGDDCESFKNEILNFPGIRDQAAGCWDAFCIQREREFRERQRVHMNTEGSSRYASVDRTVASIRGLEKATLMARHQSSCLERFFKRVPRTRALQRLTNERVHVLDRAARVQNFTSESQRNTSTVKTFGDSYAGVPDLRMVVRDDSPSETAQVRWPPRDLDSEVRKAVESARQSRGGSRRKGQHSTAVLSGRVTPVTAKPPPRFPQQPSDVHLRLPIPQISSMSEQTGGSSSMNFNEGVEGSGSELPWFTNSVNNWQSDYVPPAPPSVGTAPTPIASDLVTSEDSLDIFDAPEHKRWLEKEWRKMRASFDASSPFGSSLSSQRGDCDQDFLSAPPHHSQRLHDHAESLPDLDRTTSKAAPWDPTSTSEHPFGDISQVKSGNQAEVMQTDGPSHAP